ncbi:MAG: 50S ribosomal protein L17 [Verrucomicrobiae bacterium]|nr:50S ribosomal protein L17 [Verrucomicrobiae bacterium]
MRHRKRNAKLGRKGDHRNAMLANLVCSLIVHRRVTTTLAKAKAARPVAEKMLTLGKRGGLHHRRLAASRLHQEDAVRILFNELAPLHKDRPGGYTRIIRMGQRPGDAAAMAILEWVDEGYTPSAPKSEKPAAKAAKAAPTVSAAADSQEAVQDAPVPAGAADAADSETTGDVSAAPAAEAESSKNPG